MGELAESYKAGLDIFNRRDKEAWLAITTPELENHPPREWPEASVLRGSEAVWDFFMEIFDTWEPTTLELCGPIEEGEDIVVAPLRADLRGRGSGLEVEWAYFQVNRFRDGRLERIDWFKDREEALAAAGIVASTGGG
jgi:ketosteroid isomerase-like protein